MRVSGVVMWLLLSASAAALFAAAGDPVPGVDVSLEQKPGGNIVVTCSLNCAFDEVLLDVTKDAARGATPVKLPPGFTLQKEGRTLKLTGPAVAGPVRFRVHLGGAELPDTVGLEVRRGGTKLLSKKNLSPAILPAPQTLNSLQGVVQLPPEVSPGETIQFQVLDPAKAPAGGTWTLAGTVAEPETPDSDGGRGRVAFVLGGTVAGTEEQVWKNYNSIKANTAGRTARAGDAAQGFYVEGTPRGTAYRVSPAGGSGAAVDLRELSRAAAVVAALGDGAPAGTGEPAAMTQKEEGEDEEGVKVCNEDGHCFVFTLLPSEPACLDLMEVEDTTLQLRCPKPIVVARPDGTGVGRGTGTAAGPRTVETTVVAFGDGRNDVVSYGVDEEGVASDRPKGKGKYSVRTVSAADSGRRGGALAAAATTFVVRLPRDLAPGTPLAVSYRDLYGDVLVDVPRVDGVEVVPARPADPTPRITAATRHSLAGQTACVCGNFPGPRAWNGLRLDGQAVGTPASASSRTVWVRLPETLAPGPHTVAGIPDAGFAASDRATTNVIKILGSLDSNQLLRGQSTPMQFRIEGTDQPVSLRVKNYTPGIISIEGGNDQVLTTSGGRANMVQRTVNAVTRGDFNIDYTLEGDPCPCSGEKR